MLSPTRLVTLLTLALVCGCGSGGGGGGDTPTVDNSPNLESLEPLTGSEVRYLAFQIFEGTLDPAIPFDNELVYTPKEAIADMVNEIISTIGITGGEKTRLAFMLGPISFDHTDAEARQIIDDGFEIAISEGIAVGFHIDDAMFWRKRVDLIGDPANVEWSDFDGTPAANLLLDWTNPPARMVFNAAAIQAEVTRRARDVIGSHIASHVENLRLLGKEDLFAGVIAGWESHMGQDTATADRVGFHALANRGFGAGAPPADVNAEIASIVSEFIALWAGGLAQGGVNSERIYTHVAFLSRERFDELDAPQGVNYEDVLDSAPSSQRPAVAFNSFARPGFSTYPVSGVFDQIQEELALHGDPWWASAEGTNIVPGDPVEDSGMSMENYLARSFNHGAALVTLFGWGIGGQSVPDNPFRLETENPESIDTYREFLSQ